MKLWLKPLNFIFLFTIFITGYGYPATQSGWQDLHGKQVERMLDDNYADNAIHCQSPTVSPAFTCSGIMLRGTSHSSSYFFWNPSPSSVTSGGVSFSYLREDAKYNNLAYNYSNGYFVYPEKNNPEGKIALDVLCSFPIDAATDNRADAGCGEYQSSADSIQCQLQGITDAEGWYNHYVQHGRSHTSQCGFGLTSRYSNVADAFYQTIKAMSLIGSESFNDQNELRISTWPQDIPEKLPVEALFYLTASGLASAQLDQKDFYNQTGMYIPIIKMTLPQTSSDDATFSYSADDQVETDSMHVKWVVSTPPSINTSGSDTTSTLSARIVSSNGLPIEGAIVTWVPTSGNAVLSQKASVTDSMGIATTELSDPVAENVTVLAYGPDGKNYGAVIVPVRNGTSRDLYIDSLNAYPVSIKATGQDVSTLSVAVKSPSGADLSNANIHWSTTSGVLSDGVTTTDANGLSQVTFTSTTVGEPVITATLDNGASQSTWIDVTQ